MCGAIPPFPQYVLIAWCIVEHKDNFMFPSLQKPTIILTNGIVGKWIKSSILTHTAMNEFPDVSYALVGMCCTTLNSH
jgi:hypothetical protein